MIHLKPKACDGPFLTLFKRDLLFGFREINEEVADVVLEYFVEHGSQWLSPKNVALSLFSDCPPFSLNAVKTSSHCLQMSIPVCSCDVEQQDSEIFHRPVSTGTVCYAQQYTRNVLEDY